MGKGKTHEFFAWPGILLTLAGGLFYAWPWHVLGGLLLGQWLVIWGISPDLDTTPRKKLGPIVIFLFPYSLLFKHRGISHWPLIGLMTRWLYLALVLWFLHFVLYRMGYLSEFYDWRLLWQKGQDVQQNALLFNFFISLFLGMALGDVIHLLVDIVASFLKKLRRLF